MNPPEWTEDEVQVLLDLHAKGLTAREIAKVIPRTTQAVNSKRNRMDLYTFPMRAPVSVAHIQEAVCGMFGISMRDMLADRRGRSVARPRQIAMYLARELTFASYPAIGRVFHRDHTTIMHGCEKIELLKDADEEVRSSVETLENSLKSELFHRIIQGDACSSGDVESIECPMEKLPEIAGAA